MWGLSLFGGGAAKKNDVPKNAIIGLTENLAMMDKRQAHLTKLAEEQAAIAKKHMNDKRGPSPASHKKEILILVSRTNSIAQEEAV